MPAVTGGTGFVGFGDYEGANGQAAQGMANEVEATDPNVAGDYATAQGDAANVLSGEDASLNSALGNQVAADQSGLSGGKENNAETVRNATTVPGKSNYSYNYDPNTPTLAKGVAAGANASSLPGAPQYASDLTKANEDAANVGSQNTWGAAFGALQSLNAPNAAGQYTSAAGTGRGFDALLAQGGLSQNANAANALSAAHANDASNLQSQVANQAQSWQQGLSTPTPWTPPPSSGPHGGVPPPAPNGHNPGVVPTSLVPKKAGPSVNRTSPSAGAPGTEPEGY